MVGWGHAGNWPASEGLVHWFRETEGHPKWGLALETGRRGGLRKRLEGQINLQDLVVSPG